MELEKYIKATGKVIYDAYSEIEAALMERDISLGKLKGQSDQYSESGYHELYQGVIDKFNADTQAAVMNCRAAISEQKNGYMKEVSDFYAPDGSKIDLNDMNLIKAGFTLSADEFVQMIQKHIDNPTMLRIIEKYAAESKMVGKIRDKDSMCAVVLARAKKSGKTEEKIFDSFVHYAAMGMNHPDEHYTMYQSRIEIYEEDAVLQLLKAKLYVDDETQQKIDEIEQKQREKHNDVRKGKTWGKYKYPSTTVTKKLP